MTRGIPDGHGVRVPPAYTNEVVFLLQATSLVSIITLMDLTGVARIIVARSFETYKLYITAGLIYLAMCYLVIYVMRRLEFRLGGHLRDRRADPALTDLR